MAELCHYFKYYLIRYSDFLNRPCESNFWRFSQKNTASSSEKMLIKYMEDEPGFIKFAIRAYHAVYVNQQIFNNSYNTPVRHSLYVLLG